MASTEATVAYIFKRRYDDKRIAEASARDHVVAQMIKKSDGMTGANGKYTYAVRYANPQAIGGHFATVQGNITGSKGVQFEAARRKKYGFIRLDGEAMEASKDDPGAFLRLVTTETDGIIEEHGDALAFELHRDGTGARGQRASISSDVVTLAVKDDARNFKPGMHVIASPNADGSTPRAGSSFVVAVDEDAGTIELDDQSDITSFANSDYLFRAGDVGSAVDGFESIIPLTAPVFGSDDFRGVDRGQDTRRLAGVRIDDTSYTIEENIKRAAVKLGQVGQKGDKVAVLNPINFLEVSERADAKVTYDGGGVKATIGFAGFDIATAAGTVRAISDADAPIDRGRVLRVGDWVWKTLGQYVHIIRDDKGTPSMRRPDADMVELRTRSMGNPLCYLPAAQATFKI